MKYKITTSAFFLVILLLFTVACNAQYRKKDTVKVVMLVSDTLHYSNFIPSLNKENYFDKAGAVAYITGYSVVELHNTSDGNIDPGSCMGCNWHDYWKDLSIYLDDNKKLLSKSIVVWQVLSPNPLKK